MSITTNYPKQAAWTMRQTAHLNGGRKFFAYEYTCNEEPRLTRSDHYDKTTRSCTSTWRVDGVDQPSFAAAMATLGVSPT